MLKFPLLNLIIKFLFALNSPRFFGIRGLNSNNNKTIENIIIYWGQIGAAP